MKRKSSSDVLVTIATTNENAWNKLVAVAGKWAMDHHLSASFTKFTPGDVSVEGADIFSITLEFHDIDKLQKHGASYLKMISAKARQIFSCGEIAQTLIYTNQ